MPVVSILSVFIFKMQSNGQILLKYKSEECSFAIF